MLPMRAKKTETVPSYGSRSVLGVAPAQYLKQVRLRQARTLLQHSRLSIKEVAALIGANDLSHFSRDYKALHAESPGQTRREALVASSAIK